MAIHFLQQAVKVKIHKRCLLRVSQIEEGFFMGLGAKEGGSVAFRDEVALDRK